MVPSPQRGLGTPNSWVSSPGANPRHLSIGYAMAIHKPMAVGGTRVVGSGMRVGRSAGGSSWPPRPHHPGAARPARRVVVGNLGYDVSFTRPKSYSLPPAFADSDTATAATVEAVYTEAVGRTFGWLERHRQARRVDRGAARRPGFDPGEASRAVQRLAEQRTRGRRPRRSRPRTPPCANSGGPR